MNAVGKEVDVTIDGVADNDGNAAMTMRFGGLGTFEERVVDGVVFVDLGNLPGADRDLPAGKRWVSVDPATMPNLRDGALKGLATQGDDGSPTRGLASLQQVIGPIQVIGGDTVAGEAVTHSRGHLDLSSIDTADLPPSAADALRGVADQRVPVDVWIDGSDRVVKMGCSMELDVTGQHASMETTLQIAGFGVPVDAQAPLPDETVDSRDLAHTTVI